MWNVGESVRTAMKNTTRARVHDKHTSLFCDFRFLNEIQISRSGTDIVDSIVDVPARYYQYRQYRIARTRLVKIQWGTEFDEGADYLVDITDLKAFCINGDDVKWDSLAISVHTVCLDSRSWSNLVLCISCSPPSLNCTNGYVRIGVPRECDLVIAVSGYGYRDFEPA